MAMDGLIVQIMRWYHTGIGETSCSFSQFLKTDHESDRDNEANYGVLNEMSADTDHYDEKSEDL